MHRTQRVDCVGGTRPAQFTTIDRKQRIAGYRQRKHRRPVLRRGSVLPYLEGLFTRRDESKRAQLQFLGGNLSYDQMPMMHRIEGSAEQPDHRTQAPGGLAGQTSAAPLALGWNLRM
jgi:hypothetical protein